MTPTQSQINAFTPYWNTSILYGMQWFWDACTSSHPSWVWSGSDHVIFDELVQVPCSGNMPNSNQQYDINNGLGINELLALDAYGQLAYIAKYGQDSFNTFDRMINMNLPLDNNIIGFGVEGCDHVMCGAWAGAITTFPIDSPFPKLNTPLHEFGHTMYLLHAGYNLYGPYGDCACPMGCAANQLTCYNAPSARILGYALPVADLDDVSMPPNLWASYTLPVFTTSNTNHLTIRSLTDGNNGQATIFVSARSSTASSKGADSGMDPTLDHQVLLEGTLRTSLTDFSDQNWLIKGLKPGQIFDMRTASQLTNNVGNLIDYGKFEMNVIIQLNSMSDTYGAIIMVCRYLLLPSDCRFNEHS
jgi:hypothetical protein